MKLYNVILRFWNMIAHRPEADNLASHKPNAASGVAFGSTNDALPTVKPGQQIGFYLGSELSSDVMHYVIATCIRLDTKLTVLTFQSEPDARALLKPYQAKLEDSHIGVQLKMLSGEPPVALMHALRKRPEIAFLICNESGYLARSLKKGVVRQEAFTVPVVMAGNQAAITERAPATSSLVASRAA